MEQIINEQTELKTHAVDTEKENGEKEVKSHLENLRMQNRSLTPITLYSLNLPNAVRE